MSRRPLVSVEAVEKSFTTRHLLRPDEETGRRKLWQRRVVHPARKISFEIHAGEVFGLLGPNGAGKTTTVKMISGLVIPDRGRVVIDGYDVRKHRGRVLQKLGVVLEGTRTSIWPLTPYENLMYYGNLRGVTGRLLRNRANELIDFIGLKSKRDVEVRRLSRGEKQKLAICIALIADPQIILLDEPTTGLDVQSARAIKDKILQMARELGKAALVTTHDMHTAQELCHRIGIIDRGTLVACKPTSELLEVFSDPTFVFRLDRLPGDTALSGIPGVVEWRAEMAEDGPIVVARVTRDFDERSAALYALIERLRSEGYRLRSIEQRQQNLESVFLQLTTSTI